MLITRFLVWVFMVKIILKTIKVVFIQNKLLKEVYVLINSCLNNKYSIVKI